MRPDSLQALLPTLPDRFEGDYLFERAGDRFEGRSYAAFVADVRRAAAYLQALGLSGARIGIYAENSYAYMVADMAVMTYVGTAVSLPRDWPAADLVRATAFTEIRALLYSTAQKEAVDRLHAAHPAVLCIPLEDLLALPDGAPTESPMGYDDCVKLVFSSGTTGVPKAVMLSQRNMFACWEGLRRRAPLGSDDRCYLILPLHHTYAGVCIFLYSLITGMKIYICGDLSRQVEEMATVRPTVYCAVPLVLERLRAVACDRGLPPAAVFGGALRLLFSGGAALDPATRRFFLNGGVTLLNSYGLSETAALVCLDYPGERDARAAGTVLEHLSVRIADPDGSGVGEICVKGENVFMGYDKNPAATAAALDADGYLHTGDLGYMEGGRLVIAGRRKRVLVLPNGENIYPEEIEARFAREPAVTRVKVYEAEGKLCTDIYLRPEAPAPDMEALLDRINRDLPRTHRIKHHTVIPDTPGRRLK